jgi:hypothetical protein
VWRVRQSGTEQDGKYALVLDQANQQPARILNEISHAQARLVIEALPWLRTAEEVFLSLL